MSNSTKRTALKRSSEVAKSASRIGNVDVDEAESLAKPSFAYAAQSTKRRNVNAVAPSASTPLIRGSRPGTISPSSPAAASGPFSSDALRLSEYAFRVRSEHDGNETSDSDDRPILPAVSAFAKAAPKQLNPVKASRREAETPSRPVVSEAGSEDSSSETSVSERATVHLRHRRGENLARTPEDHAGPSLRPSTFEPSLLRTCPHKWRGMYECMHIVLCCSEAELFERLRPHRFYSKRLELTE
jgi:hypothetical protein